MRGHVGTPGVHSAGSAEIFKAKEPEQSGLPGNLAAGRRPSFAVNTVSMPLVDGTTLGSWLDGVFGAGQGDDEQRVTLVKSALALLVLAHGTPCIAAADIEAGSVRAFVAEALAARATAAALLQPSSYDGVRTVTWCDQHGNPPAWDFADARDAALLEVARSGGATGRAACLAVNASWEMVQVALPPAQGAALWQLLLDSGAGMSVPGRQTQGSQLHAGSTVWLAPKAVALFMAEPQLQSAVHAEPYSTAVTSGAAAPDVRSEGPQLQPDGTYW